MFSDMCCGRKKRTNKIALVVAAAAAVMAFPGGTSAQVANFAFTTDSQTIEAGAVSGQLTVQAQGSGGTSANIPQTACLSFDAVSSQGQFSSSATAWNPITILTMSKNTANKSFYYKNTQEGTHTLTVKVSLKPEDESRSCANWPVGEWNISWTATQNITVGTGSSSSNSETGAGASTTTTSEQTTSSENTSGDYIMPPPPKVFADGGSDRTVVVGADTEFRARAYDEKKNIIDFSRFHWNFGDGTTADTSTVVHHFEYPGRYVVVLDMPEEKDAAVDQIIVTVERVELALSLMEDGGVAIENRAGRTFDLSRWIIRSMGRTFTVPAHTFILTGSSLRFSPKTLGFSSGADVELAYPNGALALGIVPTPVVSVASSTATSIPTKYSSQTAVFEKADDYAAAREVESSSVEQSDIATTTEEITSAQAAGVGAAFSGSSGKWWLGVVGIAGLAAGSLVIARRYGKKEWDIIEETGETR